MTETRRQRALTAARIRLRSPVPRPLLDETRIDEVCAELLALEQELETATAIRLNGHVAVCGFPYQACICPERSL